MSLTFTDIFCGAGGSSTGLAAAGFELRLAANHWERAIETHSANFTNADHLCADVSNYDMRRLPKTDVLWASPECTWHSPAGGRKRLRAQLDLLEDYVPTDGGIRSRATMFDVIRATEVHQYSVVIVENVVEVADWPLFDWWLDGMLKLGYQSRIVCVSSAHIGGPDNPSAPQWRDRLYVVFVRHGIPMPNLEPRPLAWCQECDEQVHAVQSWKNPNRRKIGKYGQQYVYRCPNAKCRHAVVEPYVRPAAAAIDWTDLGTRIGDRTRPLAKNTLRRIQVGLEMFVHASVPGDGAAAPPVVVNVNHDDNRAYPAHAAPLTSRTTKIGDGIAAPPYIVELRRNGIARGVDEPLATVTAGGNHHALTVPPGAFYVKNYGGNCDPAHTVKPVTDPLSPITTRDHHALVIPYRRTNRITTTREPLHTVATRESAALVQPSAEIEDCYFRMLKPREHLRAQRFPDDYIVRGNKSEQTMQAGNAVSSNVAQWLGERVMEVLS